MFIRILLDEIACGTPTETGLNDRDEVYFALVGASHQGPIQVNRVSPPPPEDYYGLKAGQRAHNIQLWQGYLGNGESAFLTVLIREQDNAQLQAIASAIRGGVLGLGAIFVSPALGPEALEALKDAAKELVDSLADSGDQTIGAFSVRVTNRGQNFTVDWDTVATTTIVSPPPHTGPSKLFHATGSTANYTVRASVQRPHLPMIVNRNSGKCLDVADGSLADQANVQQFMIHGGSNQRWLLKPLGFAPALPVSPLPWPYYALLADHSGKCLDVAGNSADDQANVQQYAPHYGGNQSWIFVPIDSQDFVLVNLQSHKVLDITGGSLADGANVQQFRYHGGLNQRWRLQS